MSDLWLLSLIIPWLGAALLGALPRRFDQLAWPVALAFAFATTALVAADAVFRPATGAFLALGRFDWVPGLGLGALWVRDGLTVLFGLLTSGVAALVVLFAGPYMPHAQADSGSSRRLAGFYALLSAFTGAMLGLVSSGNLLQLFFFWELTSLASYLLIGFWSHRGEAVSGAARSLMLTTVGSMGLLVGLVLLGHMAGYELPALIANREAWAHAPWLGWVAGLVAVAALSKSAQFPFAGWLPGAMVAPTPVSAFLHSAALVAAGVYLLARFFPLLSHHLAWGLPLVASGVAGALVAGILALRQSKIKALLAYSTVSQYAFICLAFGLGTVAGAEAGLFAFLIHGAIKAGLFLVAGAAAHLTGETHFAAIGGLARSHPVLAGLAAVLALSLGGVPIFGGFYYKEELLYAAWSEQAWLLFAAMLVGGMLTFLYMLRFLSEIFGGEPRGLEPERRLPVVMGLPIAILAGVSLTAGLFPNWLNRSLLDPAIAAVLQRPVHYVVELALSGVLLLSLAVLGLGAILWLLYRWGLVETRWTSRLPRGVRLGWGQLQAGYGFVSDRLLDLHNGNMRRYLRAEIVAMLALVALFWALAPWGPLPSPRPLDWALTLMLLVVLVAAAGTIALRKHVPAVIALTISGYALAVVFALMDAPDVALAQVLVETLATVAIVIALRQSQQVHPERSEILTAGKRDWRRWGVSIGLGGAVGWAAYWAGRRFPPNPVGERYVEEGYARTGMADLVTAILTDFRALDTAIEILVFASAAFAVMALYRQREEQP